MAGLPRWPAFFNSRPRGRAVNAGGFPCNYNIPLWRHAARGGRVPTSRSGGGFLAAIADDRMNERAALRDGTKEEAPCDHALPLEYWVLFLPFHRRMPPPSRAP